MKLRKKLASDAEVNMTPLLDIVFIMLIFFIVSSTFVREAGLKLNKQNQSNIENSTPKRSVTLQVCKGSYVLLEERKIDFRSVRPSIEKLLAEDSQLVVLVESAFYAQSGFFTKVIDQVKSTRAAMLLTSPIARCNDVNKKNEDR